MNPALAFPQPPVMRVRISFVKVMTMPPAMVSIPLARWEGSWLLRDRPSWRMPKPSRIRPMARIREKMKSDKFSTIWRGSSAAKAGTIMTAMDSTRQAKRA